MTYEFEREAVASAARRLAAEGLVLGTAGNISVRAGEHVAVSPTGGVLASLQAADVAIVDLDGALVDGPLAPTSELDLHLGAYRRFGTGAVVHTHSPFATTLACTALEEVPVVHYAMLALGGAVPVAPYETFGTRALADVVLDALEGKQAALMANHGALALGSGAEQAVETALLLEWTCGVYWRAAQLGPPTVLDESQQQAVVEVALSRSYGATHPA